MNKAVFIDKDGTLIPDLPYNVDAHRITIQAHAVEGLRVLQEQGYLLIIVSNQSGVAKGYFKEEALQAVLQTIQALLLPHRISIDGFYYCPHFPNSIVEEYAIVCDCRKPEPGLLLKAAAEHNIDLHQSWMIGDILTDVEAGRSAGCRTVLIDNGNETEWIITERRVPDFTAATINEAAQFILRQTTQKESNHEKRLV